MKIKNISTETIYFSDLRIPAFGTGQPILNPGQEALIYDEDAERSVQLGNLMNMDWVIKISDEEPNDTSPAADRVVHSLTILGDPDPVFGAVTLEEGSGCTIVQDTLNKKFTFSVTGAGGSAIESHVDGPYKRVTRIEFDPSTGDLRIMYEN